MIPLVTISIGKADVTCPDKVLLTSGMVNAVQVLFEFSKEWEGFNKIAVFSNGVTSVDIALDSEGKCHIPHEILAAAGRDVSVGIYGSKGEGDDYVAIPTVKCSLGKVVEGVNPSGEEPSEPTPTIWDNLKNQLDKKYITAEGAPDSRTEGAVGCLYMDTTSGEVYKCVAVNEGTYTWESVGNQGADSNNVLDTYTPTNNLLNLETAEFNTRMDINGKKYTNDDYVLTDYIPVTAGEVLTCQSRSKMVAEGSRIFSSMFWIAAFNANKEIVPAKGSGAKTTKYTVPEGVAFVRVSLQSYSSKLDWSIVSGDLIVPYEKYSAEKLKTEYYDDTYIQRIRKKDLAIPEKIYSFVGYPAAIYFENVMPYNPNDVYVYKYGGEGKGKLYGNRWEYTPTVAETVIGSVDIYTRDWVRLFGQNVDVVVKNTTTKQSLKVLVIGDSTVEAGKETQKMVELASADGYSLTLLGTRGEGSNQHEGRSGWTADKYINSATFNNVPNLFYNPTSNTFDFAYYMAQQGYNSVDCVFLQLGVNDMFWQKNISDLKAGIRTYLANLETIINSIHAYDSNIKVVLNLITPCEADQDKFGGFYDLHPRWMYMRNSYEANINLIAKFRSTTNVYLNPHNAVIDTKTNFKGDVHPNDDGYAKLGTQMYSFMRAIN